MKTPQPLLIDTDRVTVTLGGKEIDLAPKEFQIIAVLAEAEEKVVSREALLDAVWKHSDDFRDSRIVDQMVARIRRKIGTDHILTVTCVGYRLVNARINTVKAAWGKVIGIERTFGARPGALVKIAVSGSALETVSAGHKVRVV